MNAIEQLACSAVEAMNRTDTDSLIQLFSEDFNYSDKALGILCTTADQLRDYTAAIRRISPGSRIEISNMVSNANCVAVEWTLHATIQVPVYVGSRDRSVHVAGMSFVQVTDGKITSWTDCYDRIDSGRTQVMEAIKGWIEL